MKKGRFYIDKFFLIKYNSKAFERNAAMAQMVEHILGKDEVTGSIPVSSSKKPSIIRRLFFVSINYLLSYNQLLTRSIFKIIIYKKSRRIL